MCMMDVLSNDVHIPRIKRYSESKLKTHFIRLHVDLQMSVPLVKPINYHY